MMVNNKITCPQCAGNQECTLLDDGRYSCHLCHYTFRLDEHTQKQENPLRVFISYSHQRSAIVQRIANALRDRGHWVWFDCYNIERGDDWRSSIRSGIESSNGVLAFLSQESLARGGVCMDELNIAVGVKYGNILTVLLQNESDLQPIPSFLIHRQWIDLHEWQDRIDSGKADNEEWIQERIDDLIQVIESKATLGFVGEITTIRDRLHIEDSAISKQGFYLSRPYVGRDWLAREIETWFDDSNGGRLCVVYGGPGTGKSAFAAHFAHWNRRAAASLFFEYDNPYFNNVRAMICEISLQLACRIPVFRQNLLAALDRMNDIDSKTDDELFESVLKAPIAGCQIDGGYERLCIVIDGLDECVDQSGVAARMINDYCSRLPDWMRVLVLCREETVVKQSIVPDKVIRLSEHIDEQINDIHQYFQERLKPLSKDQPNVEVYLNRLTENAGGVFLYACIVAGMILDGKLNLEDIEAYPANVSASFQSWFSRYFPDLDEFNTCYRLPLGIIAACDEPLPEDELELLNNWELEYNEKTHRYTVEPVKGLFAHREDSQTLLRRISLLLKWETNAIGQKTVAFMHRYIAEWYTGLASKQYCCTAKDALQALIEVWFGEIQRGNPPTQFQCLKLLKYAQALFPNQVTLLKRIAQVPGLEEAIRKYAASYAQPLSLKTDNLYNVRQNEIRRAVLNEALLLHSTILYGETAPETSQLKKEIDAQESEIAHAQLTSYLCLPEKDLLADISLVSHLMKRCKDLSEPERLALLAIIRYPDCDALFRCLYSQENAAVIARVTLQDRCVYFYKSMNKAGCIDSCHPFLEIHMTDCVEREEVTLLHLVNGNQVFCLDLVNIWPKGTVDTIPMGFAYHNDRIIGLSLPEGLRSIGKDAFSGCEKMGGELHLPQSLKSIGEAAFRGCKSLKGKLRLSKSLASIDASAFEGCSGLSGILHLPDSLTIIQDFVFAGCNGFSGDLVLPESVTYIGQDAFSCCTGFSGRLCLPASIRRIGEAAFFNCSGFRGELHFPDALTSIGNSAFSKCTGFTGGLRMPASLLSIGINAFKGCVNIDGDLGLNDALASIGSSAFEGCSGLSGELCLPRSLTSIGNHVFRGCSGFTGRLVLPETITGIGYRAFSGCTGFDGELHLPDSLLQIEPSAFEGCSGLSGELHLPDSLVYIGSKAFKGCSGFSGELILPESLLVIDDKAFFGCSGFTGVLVFPRGLTKIGDDPFGNCNGLTIYQELPNTLTEIRKMGEHGFEEFTGGEVKGPILVSEIGEYKTIDRIVESQKTKRQVVSLQGITTIPDCSICDFGDQTELQIPEGITEIGDDVIWSNKGNIVGKLTLPKGITKIGRCAFENLSGLNGELILPDTITHIESWAFHGCNGFSGQLNMPESLKYIGPFAFSGCEGFVGQLHFPESLSFIGGGAFKGCSGLTGNLEIPVSITSILRNTFEGCSGLTGQLRIPNSVIRIGACAFRRCHSLSGDLSLPDSIIEIGDSAFEECSGFTGKLDLPSFVRKIDEHAFSECCKLSGELYLPDTVTEIGDGAFYNCIGLNGGLHLSNSLSEIKHSTFENCCGLTGILHIPDSIRSIGAHAFSGCKGFTDVLRLPASLQTVEFGAFSGCDFKRIIVLNPNTKLEEESLSSSYSGVLICGHVGSTAEHYAMENGLPFEELGIL